MITGFNQSMTRMTTEDLYSFGIDLGRFLASVNPHLLPDEIKEHVDTFLQAVGSESIPDRATFLARINYGYALETNV